ncbi:hypothetical protein PRNP1_004016 [Phytophthora ramorum]
MLSISSLREKAIVGVLLVSAVVFLVKSRSGPSGSGSIDPQRKVHRPDSTLPLLENTLDILQAARDGDIHDRTVRACRGFKGEPVLIRSIGLPDKLVVSTPEAFEDVLKTQFNNFPKGSYMCENLRDLLGDGVFVADGDQWVHQRKTASNLFTMRALRDSMTAVIQRHAVVLYDILQRASDNKETLDLFRLFNRFTIEAFAEIGFGVHMGCLDSDEEHPFQKAFDRAQRALLLRRLKEDIEVINATVLDIVEKALAKRSTVSNDGIGDEDKNIVTLFLDNVGGFASADSQQPDPMHLRDIVVNFLIAGRDTTAQTLSWFFLNLTKNSDVEAAIRDEIAEKLPKGGRNATTSATATMQDVSQLVYLEAALKETLRLHPPVPMAPKYVLHYPTELS